MEEKPLHEDKPLSTCKYFFTIILFSIPIIGILCIIYISKHAKNQNLKNFSKANLWVIIIGTITVITLFFCYIAFLSGVIFTEQIQQIVYKLRQN